jgi:cobalt-zinc-cadmium efflux system outer membrane protein
MHVRYLVSLGIALVTISSVSGAERGSSYTLKELRTIARSVHPTLDSAQAAVDTSSGQLRQARAYPNPEIAIGFGRGRPRDGGDWRSENQIRLAQPIEFPGIRRWRARLAGLSLRGAEMDRLVAETVIDSTVNRLATTALLEQRRKEIALESTEVAARLHGLLARRVELGESSPMEAHKARSEWFSRRRDLLEAESALAASRSAMNLFCGGRLAEQFRIDERLEDAGVTELPANLVERLRIRNPLLQRAEIAIEEAAARTELSKKEVVPRFELFAGHENELDRTATSVGVGMTVPLWNRNRGSIDMATAGHAGKTAAARSLSMELETLLQRASAVYRSELAAVRLHHEGWTEASKQTLNIATFSFENGEASLLDVLDAQRSYLVVSLAEAESLAGLALARTEIERLIAGSLATEETDNAH